MAPPTSFSTAEQAIRAAFAAAWGSTTPVAYQNVSHEPVVGTSYVWFGVQEIPSRQVSAGMPGSRRVRHPLLVTIDVRAPVDSGPKAGRELADVAAGIFDLKTVADVSFRAADVTTVGPGEGWFRWRVTAEGYYDVFR